MIDYKDDESTNSQGIDYERLAMIISQKKTRDKKSLLKLEMALASDRTVKKALQNMLTGIEKEERRKKIIAALVCLVVLLGGAYYFIMKQGISLPSFKKESEKVVAKQKKDKKTVPPKEKEVKKVQLSESQVKKWVTLALEKQYSTSSNVPEYELKVHVGEDSLLYVDMISTRTTNKIGVFRVNAKGKLEESGKYLEGVQKDNWVALSSKYPDVSKVKTVQFDVNAKPLEEEGLQIEEFASLFAAWRKSDAPIMPLSQFSDDFSKNVEGSAIVYNFRDSNTLQVSENKPDQLLNYFYTYDLDEEKAYQWENKAEAKKEFSPELTDYIKTNQKKN